MMDAGSGNMSLVGQSAQVARTESEEEGRGGGQSIGSMSGSSLPLSAAIASASAVVASVAARQRIMASAPCFLPHGGRLYDVPASGWECRALQDDPGIAVAVSRAAFEQLVRAPEVSTIFIAGDCALTDAIISAICQRSGIPKTIFREVSDDQ